MNTPQLAERPTKKQRDYGKISRRLTAFWALYYVIASIMNVAGGDLPQRNVVENTGFEYGWLHGFYSIPNFLATLASNEYSIYQYGGGVGYDIAYVIGAMVMLFTMKSLFITWLSRKYDCL